MPWLRIVAVCIGLVLAGLALRGSEGQLLQAVDALSALRPGWVVCAVAVEVVSYVCLGGVWTVLLGRPGVVAATAVAVTAQGAASCLPAGAAVSGVLSYRQLRRWGSSRPQILSAVLLSSLLQAAALPVLVLAGEQLAPDREPIPGLRALSLGLIGVVMAVASLLVVFRRHHLPSRGLRWLADLEMCTRRVFRGLRRPHGPATGPAAVEAAAGRSELAELMAHPVPPLVLLGAVGLALGYWLSDALCLALSFFAVHAVPPWGGLLVTYAAAQLASMLPLAPGGLGVVEGSLTLGLVAYGGASSATLGAVLLYRLISFWGLLPAAAGTWLCLRRTSRSPAADPTPPRHRR